MCGGMIPRLHRNLPLRDPLDEDHAVVAGATNPRQILAQLRWADADPLGELRLAPAFEVLLESLHDPLLANS